MSDFIDSNNFLPITIVPSSPSNNPSSSFFSSKIVCCAGLDVEKMEDCDPEKVENDGNLCSKKDEEAFYDEDFRQHHRTSSHDENKTTGKLSPPVSAPLSTKNDSFLSIGTGSDLCFRSSSQEENFSAGGESAAATAIEQRRESPVFTDEAESGRFTEQESMDLTNEFAAHDDDDDEHEPDSENEIIEHLRIELDKARKELRAKNEKCEKLSEMQNIVDSEIHELTASLFQEAYKMVADANQKRHQAEKMYKEAAGKVEVLEAEVEALKTLVLTSTPSAPNRHLHPQLLPANNKKPPLAFFTSKKDSSVACRSSSPFLGHKRNHSDTVTSSSCCHSSSCNGGAANGDTVSNAATSDKEFREIDPNYYRDFTLWREKMDPTDKNQSFLKRIYQEEISPCINFPNEELSQNILDSIEHNTIIMERVCEDKPVARTCSLLLMPCTCNYRLKLDNNGDWLFISALCRNRIASVCNFLTYLRYMQQGLVKCSLIDCYWEIIRLRKNIALARLGIGMAH